MLIRILYADLLRIEVSNNSQVINHAGKINIILPANNNKSNSKDLPCKGSLLSMFNVDINYLKLIIGYNYTINIIDKMLFYS